MITSCANLCLIALLITSVLSDPKEKTSIVIPLETINSKSRKFVQRDEFNYHLPNVKSKRHKSMLQTRELGIVSMEKEPGSTRYLGKILVGSPPKPFYVLFDTGSTAMWIRNGHNCERNYHGSLTSKPTNLDFKVSYSDKAGVSGRIWSDRVSIEGLEVQNQVFGVANYLWERHDTCDKDGMLGMPPVDNQIFRMGDEVYEKPTLLNHLLGNGIISKYCFGFYFSRFEGSQNSKLHLGGYDEEIAPDPKYHSLINDGTWKLNLDEVKVNDESIYPEKALIDTGASYILTPIDDAEAFYSTISGSRKQYRNRGIYLFPCREQLSVRFTFDGVHYYILQSDLIMAKSWMLFGGHVCTGAIAARAYMKRTRYWTLGIPFLRNVYTIFDVAGQQIGFQSLTPST